MNLLLLLSALLSALTGVTGSGRAAPAAHVVAADARAALPVADRTAHRSFRPTSVLPPLATLATAVALVAVDVPTPSILLLTSRRRE